MKGLIAAAAAVLLLGAAPPDPLTHFPPALAKTLSNGVIVTAQVSNDAPIAGAHVYVVLPGDRTIRTTTDATGAFAVLGLADAYLPAYTDRHEFLTFGGERVRWFGVALFALGGILRLWPVFALGRRFSGLVAIQPGHRLMTGGVFAVIRHPSYLGLFVNVIGWALAFRAGAGVIIAVLMLLVVLARIDAEERLLGETFGAEYDAYRARTWRLFPHVY